MKNNLEDSRSGKQKTASLDEAIFWIALLSVLPYILPYILSKQTIFQYGMYIHLGIAFIALFVYKIRGCNFSNIGFRANLHTLKFTVKITIILGIFYAIVASILIFVAKIPIEDLVVPNPESYVLVWMIIAAPIAEEILFRGFLFAALRKHYNFYLAVFASALLFALMHPIWGNFGFQNINHFFGGLVFAYAYEKTNSIYPSMILHCLGNTSLIIAGQIFY